MDTMNTMGNSSDGSDELNYKRAYLRLVNRVNNNIKGFETALREVESICIDDADMLDKSESGEDRGQLDMDEILGMLVRYIKTKKNI